MIHKRDVIVLFILLSCCLFPGSKLSWSQVAETEDFALTWQDIQKLLNLDTEEIRLTWTEFRTLLEQTGNQVDIDFKDTDEIVTLKREQFQKLLGEMKPPAKKRPQPPKAYLITEAEYHGAAGEHNSRFIATFKIYVFQQEHPGYVVVPLVHTGLALRNVRVDGAPAVILTNGDWHSISFDRPGRHEVSVVFSSAQENHSLSLPVTRAVTNRLTFTIPDSDLGITVNPSLHPKTEIVDGGIRFSGYAPPSDRLQISWTRKSEGKVKRPALFYAATRTLLSVDADILRVKSELDLEIIQSSLNRVALLVPKNYEVVHVHGEAVSEWRVRESDIGQVLEIPFRYDVNRTVNFSVQAERMLSSETLASDFRGFQVLEARRETGEIGIVAESAVEVQVQESQDLQTVEYQKLPRAILAMSARPMLFAFRYAKHPYHIDINITQHERMDGITTVIESTEATALFLKEGKILYHVVYTLRNTFKQFMELTLPENALIWTVYVDNTRAKASRNKQGNVLISLVRSSGDGVKPFQVELTYTLPVDEFGLTGEGKCLLPATDIFTNKIQLSLYVPTGFNYAIETDEWKEADVIRSYDEHGRLLPETGAGERGAYRADPNVLDGNESSMDALTDADLERPEDDVPAEPSAEEAP
ncbi:MAG: hypothetical protein GY801_04115, partial [bacterium]|nr:hypothetical protein [bacterium]